MYYGDYGCLDHVKTALGITGTGDDDKLRRWITRGSRAIDALARGRRFYPWLETRYYNHPADLGGVLRLDNDLLEVSNLTTDNGDETIPATDYYLKQGNHYNQTPYDRIELKMDSEHTSFEYSSTPQKANAVTGTWGYHDDWANAWLDTGDTVQDNPLTSSATTLTLTDVDGVDAYGVTPRVSPGMLLKVESEYLYVQDTSTAANTATVVRGVNGTTAAQHAQGTAVYSFRPAEDVTEALVRIVDALRVQAGMGGVRSKKLGDYRVEYVTGVPVPAPAAALISARRRLRIKSRYVS